MPVAGKAGGGAVWRLCAGYVGNLRGEARRKMRERQGKGMRATDGPRKNDGELRYPKRLRTQVLIGLIRAFVQLDRIPARQRLGS